jgi:3'-5' exonuclease
MFFVNQGTSLSNLLLLDIETVPCAADFNVLPEIWKKLWTEKISKTMPESLTPDESFLQRAGILAEFGKVICISTGYFFEGTNKELCLKLKSICGHDEHEVLKSFLQICNSFYNHKKQFRFAGHNIKEFDVPYLCRRMLINHIELPTYLQLHGKKPWEADMADTLQWWKFGDYKNYVSLNLLAHALDVPTSKTDMDGSMVRTVYYEEQNLPRIVEYCQKDVVVVANLLLRFNNMALLEEDNIFIVN